MERKFNVVIESKAKKAWLARVDTVYISPKNNTFKVVEFTAPVAVKNNNGKVEKCYALKDGMYIGSDGNPSEQIFFFIKNGKVALKERITNPNVRVTAEQDGVEH